MNNDMNKWINAVTDDNVYESEDSCDCMQYECQECFPLNEEEIDFYAEDTDFDMEVDAPSKDAPEDVSELIAQITYMQDVGMSNSPRTYSEESLMKMSPEAITRIYHNVMGDMDESIGAIAGKVASGADGLASSAMSDVKSMAETSSGGVSVGGDQGKVEDEEGIYEDGDDHIYQEQGYTNRKDYLSCLADDNDVPIDIVMSMASLYGPTEDFDGLVTAVEDYAEMFMESEISERTAPVDLEVKVINNIPRKKAKKFLEVLERVFPNTSFIYDPSDKTITARGEESERASAFADKIRLAISVSEGMSEATDPNDSTTMDMFDDESDHYDFKIGAEFANALSNGDTSGLSDLDERKLELFLKQLPSGGTWSFDVDQMTYDDLDQVTGQFSNRVVPAKYTFRVNEEMSRMMEMAGIKFK